MFVDFAEKQKNIRILQRKKKFTLAKRKKKRYNDDKLLYYICYSYNCYELLHNKGNLSLITNPDALFKTPEAEQQFIVELKDYIRDIVGIKREDVQYGRVDNNRSNANNTQNWW